MIYLAQAKGFFEDEGVEVDLVDFGSLSDSRRAHELGKLDGLATTVVDVLMVRDASEVDPEIIRVFNVSEGADVIVARKEIGSVKDLRGKRVGVELASLGIFVLARALEQHGLSLDDVTPVSKDQRTMCEDVLDGTLDAAVTHPPEGTRVLADPAYHALFTSAEMPGEVVDVLAVNRDVLDGRSEDVAALQAALDRAFEHWQDNPEEAHRIMARRHQVSPEQFGIMLTNGIRLVPPSEQQVYFNEEGLLKEAVDGSARFLQSIGLLSKNGHVTNCLPEL